MRSVLIAILAVVVAAVSTAEAKPRKHHRAHHRHHHSTAVKQVKPNPFVFSFAGFGNPMAAAAQSKRTRASKHSSSASYSGASFAGFGSGASLIATARSYAGTNPTRRSRQWCGEFMGLVVRKTGGRVPEGYAKASSWAKLPHTTMHVGAVAVMPHHVGIVTGECEGGGVRIVSGNHGRRVGEGCYPRRRIIAFVTP